MSTVVTYIRESIEELHHVRWPTRQQAVRLSLVVLVFTLVSALAFGITDFVLSEIITFILPR